MKNKLREIRMREYLMDQKEFASFLGVSNKVYWSWENNKSRPTLEGSLEIASKLNKKIEDIWCLE